MSTKLLRGGALSLAMLLALRPAPARADLDFAQPLASAGEVRSGTPLAHSFRFVNSGSDAAEITGTRASCGCLTPRLAKRVFQPGEAGTVELDVHTLSQNAGPHKWRVFVTYRSGNITHEFPLQLSAQVITEVTVQPANLTVFAGSAVGHDLVVTDLRPKPLTITDVRTSTPKLRARLAETYQDNSGRLVRKVRLEIADDYPEGRHDEAVNLYTDDPTYRDLRVPVTVIKQSRQRLAVLPDKLTFTAASGDALPSQLVRVRDSAGREVVVEEVTADNPAVTCRWARGPGAMTTVKVVIVRSRTTAADVEATVRIRTSQPVPQTLELPLRCHLQ